MFKLYIDFLLNQHPKGCSEDVARHILGHHCDWASDLGDLYIHF